MMQLGKIVKSNSHIDYICQIYNPNDVPLPPTNEDYAFGTFVKIPISSKQQLVGVVYDTVLFNPEFGRIGPRLFPESDLAVFTPDLLNEKAILIGILTVGMFDNGGNVFQGVPRLSSTTDAIVEKMIDTEIREFHCGNSTLRIGYIPLLLSHSSPLTSLLLQKIVSILVDLFPDQNNLLSVLQNDLAWKSQVTPLGGAR
jgi:hypothetical protein